jgi:hypothetical protein
MGELYRVETRHSRLKLTDIIQQRLRRVFPLSLHALPDGHEEASGPLREADAVLLVRLDVLASACVSARTIVITEREGR